MGANDRAVLHAARRWQTRWRRFATIVSVAMLTSANAPVATRPVADVHSSTLGATASTVTGSSAPALTREDLNVWLDGFMPYALARGDVAGAVVVIVQNGQVLFQKGYGYADVSRRIPVSPERTLFRTGSTGKLFTWTAVMQLVEQGRLDLDRNVNDYIDFKIPATFDKPITMRNLLQHTAGFEDHAKYIFVDDIKDQRSIGAFLKHNIPARIFPPGRYPAYSNYGATLAGYIVERISGESYETYIRRHVFAPLGMTRSTLEQPLPPSLAGDMSNGYLLGSGQPQKFEIANVAPAGGGSNTGADMGRFMLAHLNNGELDGHRILRDDTAREMHRQSFQATPPLPGFALGFYRSDRNDRAIIAHEGDTNLFHSDLELLPDQGVGFFVSVNSLGKEASGKDVRTAVFASFMDRYFPAPVRKPEPLTTTAKQHGALMVGRYELTRRIERTMLDLVYTTGQNQITMDDEGLLSVGGITTLGGATKRWREVAPFVWRDVAGNDRMAAKLRDKKIESVWFDETVPAFVLQKVPVWRSGAWIIPALLVSLATLLLAVIGWPLTALIRKHYAIDPVRTGRTLRLYRVSRLGALASAIGIGGIATVLVTMAGSALSFNGSSDGLLRGLQILIVLGLLSLPFAALLTVTTWRDGASRWPEKLTDIAVVLALATASIVAILLHLLNWRLAY